MYQQTSHSDKFFNEFNARLACIETRVGMSRDVYIYIISIQIYICIYIIHTIYIYTSYIYIYIFVIFGCRYLKRLIYRRLPSIAAIPPGWALQLATRNATIFSRLPILRGLHQKGLKNGRLWRDCWLKCLAVFLRTKQGGHRADK